MWKNIGENRVINSKLHFWRPCQSIGHNGNRNIVEQ